LLKHWKRKLKEKLQFWFGKLVMKSYVITIFGLHYSELAAARCINSAKDFNFPVKFFCAVNRYQAKEEMEKLGFFVNKNFYAKVSDKPIGDRGLVRKGEWELTTSELACFLSHYKLWEKSIIENENIIIFEHDVEIVSPIHRLPEEFIAANFDYRGMGAAAYTITPQSAKLAIAEVKKHGIQPADELLWSTALKHKPVYTPDVRIIKLNKEGISTIQWQRNDQIHQHIKKEDPWIHFHGLGKEVSFKAKEFTSTDKPLVKKSITLPVHNRPYYLARTLNSLSKLNTSGYQLFVNIEPDNEASLDLIKQIDFMEVNLQINETRLGVRDNPFNLIERAFAAGSEWNYHIEDDLIFAPDVMNLVNWYFDNRIDDVLIYGTCNRQKLTNNVMDCDVYVNPVHFSGLGWCVDKKNWHEHIRNIWFDASPNGVPIEEGWDWNIVRYLRYGKYAEMLPILSRSNTIGEFGTYSSKQSHSTFLDLKLSECINPEFRLLR